MVVVLGGVYYVHTRTLPAHTMIQVVPQDTLFVCSNSCAMFAVVNGAVL